MPQLTDQRSRPPNSVSHPCDASSMAHATVRACSECRRDDPRCPTVFEDLGYFGLSRTEIGGQATFPPASAGEQRDRHRRRRRSQSPGFRAAGLPYLSHAYEQTGLRNRFVARGGDLVYLVYLVYLVCLVYLVERTKEISQAREPERPA